MKIKTLCLSLLSALLFSACGNDKEDTNTTIDPDQLPTTPFQQWTTFYTDFNENNELNIQSTQITIDNGKYYSKTLLPTEDYEPPIFVTQNGLYDIGPLHPTYGYFSGNIEIAGNAWKKTFYSSIGSQGLSWTRNFKHQNLSGKNLAEVFMLYEYLQPQYLPEQVSESSQRYVEKLQNIKFPQGATCLSWHAEEISEDHIEIEAYDALNASDYQQQWNTLANQTNPLADKYVFKNTIAYFEPNGFYGYAQYLDRYHTAYYYQKGVENFEAYAEQYRQDILNDKSISEKERQFQLAVFDYDSPSCDLFNPTALDVIHSAFK